MDRLSHNGKTDLAELLLALQHRELEAGAAGAQVKQHGSLAGSQSIVLDGPASVCHHTLVLHALWHFYAVGFVCLFVLLLENPGSKFWPHVANLQNGACINICHIQFMTSQIGLWHHKPLGPCVTINLQFTRLGPGLAHAVF